VVSVVPLSWRSGSPGRAGRRSRPLSHLRSPSARTGRRSKPHSLAGSRTLGSKASTRRFVCSSASPLAIGTQRRSSLWRCSISEVAAQSFPDELPPEPEPLTSGQLPGVSWRPALGSGYHRRSQQVRSPRPESGTLPAVPRLPPNEHHTPASGLTLSKSTHGRSRRPGHQREAENPKDHAMHGTSQAARVVTSSRSRTRHQQPPPRPHSNLLCAATSRQITTSKPSTQLGKARPPPWDSSCLGSHLAEDQANSLPRRSTIPQLEALETRRLPEHPYLPSFPACQL